MISNLNCWESTLEMQRFQFLVQHWVWLVVNGLKVEVRKLLKEQSVLYIYVDRSLSLNCGINTILIVLLYYFRFLPAALK